MENQSKQFTHKMCHLYMGWNVHVPEVFWESATETWARWKDIIIFFPFLHNIWSTVDVENTYVYFHMYRGLFCWCVGLPIITSEGLADRLQWRCISPVIKAHRSAPRGRREEGDLANASVKVLRLASELRDCCTGPPIGGGDIFLGFGDNLLKEIIKHYW